MVQECLPERHPPGRSWSENPIEQCVDILDEEMMVESNPIPFENREFQVVVRPRSPSRNARVIW